MKNYKPSQFNILTELEDGSCVIRNLLTRKFLIVTPESRPAVQKLLQSTHIEETAVKDFDILLQDGMLVEEDTCEYQQVDEYKNAVARSEERLDLTILPTNACNFRCGYCFESECHEFMSEDTVRRILRFFDENFRRYRSVNIQWFGGEPLLCKDHIERIMQGAIEIAKRDKVALISGITTNGYEMDIDTYRMLCRNRIRWAQLSVDGTRETHNSQRPHKTDPDSYTRIMNNLKDIRDNCKETSCKIYYRITLSKTIYSQIDEVLRIYKEEFAHDKRFILTLQSVFDWGGDRVKNMYDELPEFQELSSAMQKAATLGVMPIGYHTQARSAVICEAVRKNAFVLGPGNDVYKCTMAIYNTEPGDLCRGKVGYLDENGSLCLNEAYNREWMTAEPLRGPACHKCEYYAICYGGTTCVYGCKFQSSDAQSAGCRKPMFHSMIPNETKMQYRLGLITDRI